MAKEAAKNKCVLLFWRKCIKYRKSTRHTALHDSLRCLGSTIEYVTQLEYVESEALRFVFDLARHSNTQVTLRKINSPEQLNIFKDEQFPDEVFTQKQVDAIRYGKD